jgi:nucleoid-associated protein YgaU
MPGPAPRTRNLARGLAALIGLVIIVAGVPLLLVKVMPLVDLEVSGWPSIADIRSAVSRKDNGELAAAVIVFIAWACCALFTISLVPEVIGVLRKKPSLQLPGLAIFQRPAGVLVALIAIGFGLIPVGGVGHASATPLPPLPTANSSYVASRPALTPLVGVLEPVRAPARYVPLSDSAQPVANTDPAESPPPTHTVKRHDTLWAIAETRLGNPLRYPEIVALNRASIGPDNEIDAGTVLVLPPDATPLVQQGAVSVDVVVKRGDTLSGLVEEVTGSQQWRPAWNLNEGRSEPGGATYDDPDLIRPGWTLTIPTPRTAPTHGVPATGPAPSPRAENSPPTTPEPSSPTAAPTDPGPGEPSIPAASSATPAAEAPTATPTPEASPTRDAATTSVSSNGTSSAVFAAGGGVVLAAGTFVALAAYRRRQQRHRRPGRVVAAPPASTASLERDLRAVGEPGRFYVDSLHRVLLDLANRCEARGLPEVAAVRLALEEIALVLAEPDPDVPEGWTASDDCTRWTTTREITTDPDPGDRFAPYPLLVSVGRDADGASWLLNLEQSRVLALVGDSKRSLDLARFIAAELAHNAWAEMVEVALVGFGSELVDANPDRLRSVSREEPWPRHTSGEPWVRQVRIDVGQGDVPELVVGSAAVTIGASSGEAVAAEMSPDGALALPSLGLTLIAEQLLTHEAAAIAELLASAAELEDEPVPAAHDDEPWDQHADATGGLIVPDRRSDDAVPAPIVQVVPTDANRDALLPLSPTEYEYVAATVAEDVEKLSPVLPREIREEILDADPALDGDIRDWFAEDCPRPRISVLGPVAVRCTGKLPERSPQEALHTEAAVLIALHRGGIPSSIFAESLWPNDPDVAGKSKVHAAVTRLRKWLGQDPTTGSDYLPTNSDDPWNAKYRIDDVLVDAELFRRLRIRGAARGMDGIDDLVVALSLVQGPPFHNLPKPRAGSPGGYAWLTEGNTRLDLEYLAMIVDAAHTVSTYCLGAGEPERAIDAAQVALSTGTYDDTPFLDLIKANLDLGREVEAEGWVQQLLVSNGAEIEEDLPRRTAEVLFRLQKQWRHLAG